LKIDELELLAAELNIEEKLIKPDDIEINVSQDSGLGDLKNTFPVLKCDVCKSKCCASRLDLRLFDIAKFMDKGLDHFITGTFEHYMEHFLAISNGNDGLKHPLPYIIPGQSRTSRCIFFGEDEKCGIYDTRLPACRAFPLGLTIDGDSKTASLHWSNGCHNYETSPDDTPFRELLDAAIENWNEGLKNHILLINHRDQLMDLGFGKYVGNLVQA